MKKEDEKILENLSQFKEEDLLEKERESRLKRVIITSIGIILGILIITNLVFTFSIVDLIQGQIVSEPIIEDTIELDDFSIIFENNTYETIRSFYFEEPEVEFSVCLLGYKQERNVDEKTTYYITSLYPPKIYSQSLTHVSFESCSNDTLIILHTHPYKSCIASQADILALNKTREVNPSALMVVMCEPARFSVY
mgnify:CR=1 FL=1